MSESENWDRETSEEARETEVREQVNGKAKTLQCRHTRSKQPNGHGKHSTEHAIPTTINNQNGRKEEGEYMREEEGGYMRKRKH